MSRRVGRISGALASALFIALATNAASLGAVVRPAVDAVQNGPIFFERFSLAEGGSDIFRINPDGTGLRNLTRDLPSASAPFVSHDGSRVFFTMDSDPLQSDDDRRFGIYSMRPDGSGKVRLPLPSGANFPSVAHGRLVYQRCDVRVLACVPWTSTLDGRNQRQILPNDRLTIRPEISPDGSRILVAIRPNQPPSPFSSWVVPIDGGPPVEVGMRLPGVPGGPLVGDAWSYDGAALVGARFDTFGKGVPGLVAPDGSGVEELPWSGGAISAIAISPDGRQIVAQHTSPMLTPGVPQTFELRAIGLDGSGDLTLRSGPDEHGTRVSWSVATPVVPLASPQPDGVVDSVVAGPAGQSLAVTASSRHADAVIAQGFSIVAPSASTMGSTTAVTSSRVALRADGMRIARARPGSSTRVRLVLQAKTSADRRLLARLLRAGRSRFDLRVTFLTRRGGERVREHSVLIRPRARRVVLTSPSG